MKTNSTLFAGSILLTGSIFCFTLPAIADGQSENWNSSSCGHNCGQTQENYTETKPESTTYQNNYSPESKGGAGGNSTSYGSTSENHNTAKGGAGGNGYGGQGGHGGNGYGGNTGPIHVDASDNSKTTVRSFSTTATQQAPSGTSRITNLIKDCDTNEWIAVSQDFATGGGSANLGLIWGSLGFSNSGNIKDSQKIAYNAAVAQQSTGHALYMAGIAHDNPLAQMSALSSGEVAAKAYSKALGEKSNAEKTRAEQFLDAVEATLGKSICGARKVFQIWKSRSAKPNVVIQEVTKEVVKEVQVPGPERIIYRESPPAPPNVTNEVPKKLPVPNKKIPKG